jgi:hypothetical protein
VSVLRVCSYVLHPEREGGPTAPSIGPSNDDVYAARHIGWRGKSDMWGGGTSLSVTTLTGSTEYPVLVLFRPSLKSGSNEP